MNWSLREIPIKRKVVLMIMLTTGVALILACSAAFLFEYKSYRDGLKRELVTLSRIVAANCTAHLNFGFQDAARETLFTLQAEPHIVAACIYQKDGTQFARYQPEGRNGHIPDRPLDDGFYSARGYLSWFGPVLDEKTHERVATVYLQSDDSAIWDRLQVYFGVLVIVLLACSGVALGLSARLQRFISEPILALVNTARVVSERKDYSVRAEKKSGDELGNFTEAFNQMLTQIQAQDAALRQAKEELEKRVEERTRELQLEIAERKRAEQHLAEQAKELARSNAELEQFAYVASHDLQEPLRMVANFTQLLARRFGDKLDEDGREFVKFAVDGALRMQKLIDDLLEYSRVRRRGKPFVPVDTGEALDQALFNLCNSIEETHAVVTRDPLPVVHGDTGQFVQLFQNLISNAVKFRGERRSEVHVSAVRKEDHWQFSVRDNGIGIDPAHAERIFIIFQRLHGYSDYPGTGIGLAICKRIVERHGGRIWVESQLGQGATFHFTVPFDPGNMDQIL